MNVIASGLWLLAGAALVALVGALLFARASPGWRALLSGALTCLVGFGGVLAGAGALAGGSWSLTVPGLLPLSQAVLAVDALSGLFMTLVGAVAIAAGIYSVAYPHSHDQAPDQGQDRGHADLDHAVFFWLGHTHQDIAVLRLALVERGSLGLTNTA